MKRSKLFLTASTLVLGVAAIAASKANFTSVTGYYTSVNGNCTVASIACTTVNTGVPCTVGTTHIRLYTRQASQPCQKQLFKKF